MEATEMLAKSKQLYAEAKEILGREDASAEDVEKVEKLMADANRFKADAFKLNDITKAMDELESQTKVEEQKREQENKNLGEEFDSVAEMLQSISVWIKAGIRDHRLKWYKDSDGSVAPFHSEVKNLAEAVGASGGFLVPTEFIATLYSLLPEGSIVRSRASIIPMRRRSVEIPVLDQTGTGSGVPHWFGGMTFYWAEEGAAKTETDPEFRRIELVAHKLIGYTVASDELVADSAISLEALLTGEMGFVGGARWHEDYAFINGTGAGQPLGVILAGATITVARQAQNTVGYIDLANMEENFLPNPRPSSTCWVISQSLKSEILQIQDPAGNYIWQPNAREGIPPMIFGKPVVWTEKTPFRGTTGDIILADWSYYLVGDRQAATVESTQYDRWRYDETSWRMVHRVDGQPWLSAPMTLQDGTSQISPFVILGDKST